MLKNYIKIALKVLRRRKFFTFISLFGISFTLIVLNVATAFIVKMWSNDAPESQMDRMLISGEFNISGPETRSNYYGSLKILHGYFTQIEIAEKQSFFSERRSITNFVNGKKLKLNKRFTDAAYWDIFDFDFIEGKAFSQSDYDKGNRFVVITEYLKQQYFGDEAAVGKYIDIEKFAFRVIGVVKTVSETNKYTFSDLWVPTTSLNENFNGKRYISDYRAVFLAKSAEDFELIKAEFQKRVKQIPMPSSEYDKIVYILDSKFEARAREMSGDIEDSAVTTYISTLIGAAFLFMLLPAINLININTSRIMERTSEIAVRKSFGASSGSLVVQFVVENIILTLIGGIIALLITEVVLRQITVMGIIKHTSYHIDLYVFSMGLLCAIIFGLLSGVFPAYKMSRLNPADTLKGVHA